MPAVTLAAVRPGVVVRCRPTAAIRPHSARLARTVRSVEVSAGLSGHRFTLPSKAVARGALSLRKSAWRVSCAPDGAAANPDNETVVAGEEGQEAEVRDGTPDPVELTEELKKAKAAFEAATTKKELLENESADVAQAAVETKEHATEKEAEATAAMQKVEEALTNELQCKEMLVSAEEELERLVAVKAMADADLEGSIQTLQEEPKFLAKIQLVREWIDRKKEKKAVAAGEEGEEEEPATVSGKDDVPNEEEDFAVLANTLRSKLDEVELDVMLNVQEENVRLAEAALEISEQKKEELEAAAQKLAEIAVAAADAAAEADSRAGAAMGVVESAFEAEVTAGVLVESLTKQIKELGAPGVEEEEAAKAGAGPEADEAKMAELQESIRKFSEMTPEQLAEAKVIKDASAVAAPDEATPVDAGGVAEVMKEVVEGVMARGGDELVVVEPEIVDESEVRREVVAMVPAGIAAMGEANRGVSEAGEDGEGADKPKGEAPQTKKSSKFYPASFFTSAGDVEDALPVFMATVKKLLPQLVLATVLAGAALFGGAAVVARNRTTPTTTLQTVASAAARAVDGVRSGGKTLGKMAKKMPMPELQFHDQGMLDTIWLLFSSVVAVPLFSMLPGGSPVLGFLAGGAMVGPHAFGIIKEVEAVRHIAELGVVFLLFNIGLELSFERLAAMKKYVFGLGSMQVLTALAAVGFCATTLGGLTGPGGVIVGGAMALSSTAVVLQVLQDRGESSSRHGRATFSVLLLQDLAVVALLMLVPLLAPNPDGTAAGMGVILQALGKAAIKAIVCIAGIVGVGRLLCRPVYKRIAGTSNAEIFAATTLLICIGTSVLTQAFGLSMALGAFLAGLLIAETEFALQVESDIAPYRGILLGLFFMTVGMEINPAMMVMAWKTILVQLSALVIGKTALMAALGPLFGLSLMASIRAGLLLAPSGEFAFVIFGEAVNVGILPTAMSSQLFLVVALSMAITPWLAAGGQAMATRFEKQDTIAMQPVESEVDDLNNHVIIAGFGRVGQIIAQLLSERLIPFVALDVRSERVSQGRALDLPVFFGDAGSPAVLKAVGADRATCAVITLDTPGANYRSVWNVKKNFPHIKTYVRAHDVEHGLILEKAGATAVVPETLEPSLQLAAAVLQQLDMSSEEVASTLDSFRRNHLAELVELAGETQSSLGYGWSRGVAGQGAGAGGGGGEGAEGGGGEGAEGGEVVDEEAKPIATRGSTVP